jgi:DegV family protein with EDD domain
VADVAVVTDSAASLPLELAARLGIEIVSQYVEIGGTGMRRELELNEDFGTFYEGLIASDALPESTAAPVNDFTAVYDRLLASHNRVVSVHVSSAVSPTCENARQAAAQVDGERVVVIDTAGVAGHQGLQALAASRAAAAGEDVDGVVARVRQARQEVRMWGLVETLEYLRRGGRMSTATMWLGSVLDIKPIVTIESELKAIERVRTRKRGIERLIELMRQRRSVGADRWFVQHAHTAEDARQLADRLREIFATEPEFVAELGPATGVHGGPGSMWVGSVTAEALR